jgi:hypothetical protein
VQPFLRRYEPSIKEVDFNLLRVLLFQTLFDSELEDFVCRSETVELVAQLSEVLSVVFVPAPDLRFQEVEYSWRTFFAAFLESAEDLDFVQTFEDVFGYCFFQFVNHFSIGPLALHGGVHDIVHQLLALGLKVEPVELACAFFKVDDLVA